MDRTVPERKTVRVSIFNQTYNLVASGNSKEVEELAHQVDELMFSIAQRAGNLDSNRVAVLASLHLADRLRSVERELAGHKREVDEKTRKFSLLLDQVISEAGEPRD